MRPQKLIVHLLVPIFCLFVVSCMALPRPIPIRDSSPSNYDGNWAGTTSQQTSVIFTVKSNTIAYLSIKANLTKNNCNYNFNFENRSAPIEDDKFSIKVDSGAGILYVITGIFSSSTSASGTLEISDTRSICKGSIKTDWSASAVLEFPTPSITPPPQYQSSKNSQPVFSTQQ